MLLLGVLRFGPRRGGGAKEKGGFSNSLKHPSNPDLAMRDKESMFCDKKRNRLSCADSTGWDTSQVTTVGNMFNDAKSFNCDLSDWDVSSMTDLSFMY